MSSPVDVTKLLEWASERWERASTIILVLFLLALACLWKFSGSDLGDLSLGELFFILCVCAAVFVFWHITVRLPKCRRGQVGVGIAITAESKDEYGVLASDFVAALRRLLDRGETSHRFCLVEVPQHYSAKVRTTEDAIRIRQRCRCQFMIWGTARLRTVAGRQKHLLNLEGLVSHSAIPQQLQREFSREFTELFPRNVHVDRENDVISLEVTSEWVDCVARYVIGIAAALSGDIDYAQSLFLSVQHNPRLRDCPLPAIRKIRQRTPVRLGEIYALRGSLAYQKWRRNQDPRLLDEMRTHLAALTAIDPANYSGRLLRAIYHFVAEKNVLAAQAEVRKCRDVRDATWRYNYAFLLAYQGQLRKARRMYNSAFAHYCADSVPIETEEFILRVLQNDPTKIQLHFCLGLINWRGKNDASQAIHDFSVFLAAKESILFPEERRLAEGYLATLQGDNERQKQKEPNKCVDGTG